MRLKLFLALILMNIMIFNVLAQENNKSILIYSEGQGYLKPFVEKEIKNLVLNNTNLKYFKRVNLFDRFILDNKYQSELRDLVDRQKPEGVNFNAYYSSKEKEVRRRIFNVLIDYDYFLVINTTSLGELIEFQFELYKTEKSKNLDNNVNVPFTISDRLIGVENFFINPKESEYKDEIINAIKRLFKGSNKPPIAELKIFDEKVISGQIIRVPLQSDIELSGLNSGDYDSKELTYIWRNIPNQNEKIQTANRVEFINDSPSQKIKIQTSGFYNIGFKVYDGIEYSNEIKITLEAITKPKIFVYDTLVNTINFLSVFKEQRGILERKGKTSYRLATYYKGFEDKLFVSNKLLKNGEKINPINIDTTVVFVNKSELSGDIIFKTRFFSFSSNERMLYLYNKAVFDILSDPVIIKHKLIKRNFVNLYPKYTISSLLPTFINAQNDEEQINDIYLSLGVGFFLSKNIELESSFPLIEIKEVRYDGFNLLYPAIINNTLKYHIYLDKDYRPDSIHSFYFGPIHNLYGIIEESERLLKLNTLGLKIGTQTKAFSFKEIKFDFYMEASYSQFISQEELSNVGDLSLSFGLKARFQ